MYTVFHLCTKGMLSSSQKIISTHLLNSKSTLCESEIKPVKKPRPKSFIINNDAADMMITNIKKDIMDNDVFIEIDPQGGLLTRKFLHSFDNKLLLFERPDNLLTELKTLFPSKIKNLTVSDFTFHYFSKYFFISKVNPDSTEHFDFVQTLMSHCKPSENLKIFGTVDSAKFFHALPFSFTSQTTLYEGYLNPSLYLFVPFNIYASIQKLLKQPFSWRLGIVISNFFDITVLGFLPQNYFHISLKRKLYRGSKKLLSEWNKVYLLRIIPKDINLMKQMIGGDILTFRFFIAYLLRIKYNSNFILSLEDFIPNCGEEFIKNGFRLFDRQRNFSEREWIRAFQIFSSCPGFGSSAFLEEEKRFHAIFYYDRDIADPRVDEEQLRTNINDLQCFDDDDDDEDDIPIDEEQLIAVNNDQQCFDEDDIPIDEEQLIAVNNDQQCFDEDELDPWSDDQEN